MFFFLFVFYLSLALEFSLKNEITILKIIYLKCILAPMCLSFSVCVRMLSYID